MWSQMASNGFFLASESAGQPHFSPAKPFIGFN